MLWQTIHNYTLSDEAIQNYIPYYETSCNHLATFQLATAKLTPSPKHHQSSKMEISPISLLKRLFFSVKDADFYNEQQIASLYFLLGQDPFSFNGQILHLSNIDREFRAPSEPNIMAPGGKKSKCHV